VYPGVEIHATVIDNILTERFLTRPSWSNIYDLLAIVALGTLVGLCLPRYAGFSSRWGLLISHIVVARLLFVHTRVWLSIVYPIAGVFITYTTLTLHSYVTEQRERKGIAQSFGSMSRRRWSRSC
jgi:adenylate cyclase